MVSMDANRGPEEDRPKLFKGFHDGEKLFFDGGIVALSGIQFTGIVSNRSALLLDNGAKLVFAGIRFNIKGQGVVRKDQESIGSDQRFHTLKGLLMCWCPNKSSFTGKLGEGPQDMGATGPHVAIRINHPKERAKLLHINRQLELQYGVDLLPPRFYTFRSQPMAQEVSFLYGPFAFERIDSETDVLQASQDKRKKGQVVVPVATEDANVIHIKFNVLNAIKNQVIFSVAMSGDSPTPMGNGQ